VSRCSRRTGQVHAPASDPGPPIDPSLYVILDRTATRGRDLEEILAGSIAGGCRMVQLREKEWPSGRLLPIAARLRGRCQKAGVIFVVNDRLDLALAVDADGVHLGQDDLPARAARPLLRPGMLLGVSTHNAEQARAAQADGADYVAVGSMFSTQSKPDFELVGPGLIRELRGMIHVPLVGIGGITLDNVGEVIRAGADGVAVISAVCAAPDPTDASRRFLVQIDAARGLTPRGSPL
jgi:thiamine-phosphate pyrophosphorylase